MKSAALRNDVANEKVEEPIWKAIRETFSGMSLKESTPLKKALFIFLVVVLVVQYGGQISVMAMPLAVCYVIYYIIWTNLTKQNQRQVAAKLNLKPRPDQRAHTAAGSNPAGDTDKRTVAWPVAQESVVAPTKRENRAAQRRIRSTWRDRANQQLAAKPLRAKLSELLGSMLMATLFATLAACIAPLLLRNEADSEQMASFIWLALVGTLGAWAVLVPSKFAEGKVEDHTPHRVSLLLLGTLVGVAAWGLGDVLMLKSPGWSEPFDVGTGLITHEMLGWPQDTNHVNPPIAVYVAYFAFLFLVPRWWRQAEFTRTARVSIWSAIACIGWAWLLHIFWWFPQPLGMMAAGVIAVATQLASPWMPPSQRRALSEPPTGGNA